MGPVIIGSLLKQEGHDVEIISEYVTRLNTNELNDADLVGISITTYNAPRGFAIAAQISKPVVFGGIHASLMPGECLQYGDYVIRGDGHSVVELAHSVEAKKNTEFEKIPNLVFNRNGQIVSNDMESKCINIVPDFKLVRNYYKFNLNRLLRLPLLVNASRGCPNNCSFCAIKAVYKDVVKKDKEVVIGDIKNQIENQHFLSRFVPRVIWITDDNFFSDKLWAKEVLKAIAQLKTSYKFNIQAEVGIASDKELLELMRKANVRFISLGIESLKQSSLDNFSKNSSPAQINDAIWKLKCHGIEVHGLFVFGDEEFRKGDGLLVAQFVKRNGLSGALIQPLTPFPGTKLFKRLKRQGRIMNEDWENYGDKVVFRPKKLTAGELQREIYECYRRIYSSFWVIKFLLFGRKGFRLIMFGIALFRYLEGRKTKNYIRDKLS